MKSFTICIQSYGEGDHRISIRGIPSLIKKKVNPINKIIGNPIAKNNSIIFHE